MMLQHSLRYSRPDLKRFIRPIAQTTNVDYSDGYSKLDAKQLHLGHKNFKYIEDLFAKYRLDRTTDLELVKRLEDSGEITTHLANIIKDRISKEEEAGNNAKFWERIFWFGAVPMMSYISYIVYHKELEHAKHLEEHPPELKKYPYMKVATKKFPWGDGEKTLFHNEHNL